MSLLWIQAAAPVRDGDAVSDWQYQERRKGTLTATSPEGVESDHYIYVIGNGLTRHRHPEDVPVPLYHGTPREIPEGAQIEPGHPGNFVRRMKHVYMTESPQEARKYAGPDGNVYQVRPIGWYGHRSDARGRNWASERPLDVIDLHSGPTRERPA